MYKVVIRKSALKELSKLPTKEALRVANKINQLKDEPRPSGTIKLRGSNNEYRIRIGNYRVLYTVQDELLIVEVFKVGDRKNIY